MRRRSLAHSAASPDTSTQILKEESEAQEETIPDWGQTACLVERAVTCGCLCPAMEWSSASIFSWNGVFRLSAHHNNCTDSTSRILGFTPGLSPQTTSLVSFCAKQGRAIASNFGNRLYEPCYNEPIFKALPYRCPLQAALNFRCDCPSQVDPLLSMI